MRGVARGIVVQVQPSAPPGLLAPWAGARGHRLEVAHRADGLPPAAGHDFAVVLGSSASLAQDPPPWAPEVLGWLRDADAAGVPVLGICFGAQAIAAALGGEVHRLPEAEVGWIEVVPSDPLVPAGPWVSWHEDAITPPPGAEVLATGEAGLQAFALGPHLGVQFHPEATADIAAGWAADSARDATALVAAARAGAAAAEDRARRLFDAFLRRAGR
jgi:GMP synthase-like glutamine amidotransferase